MEELFEKMAETLIAGNEPEVKSLTQEALDKAPPPAILLTRVCWPAWMWWASDLKPVTCLSPRCFYAPAVCMGPWIF